MACGKYARKHLFLFIPLKEKSNVKRGSDVKIEGGGKRNGIGNGDRILKVPVLWVC